MFAEDREVGVVTSGTTVPHWKFTGPGEITDETDRRCLALALIDAELGIGQELQIAVRKRRLKARIVRSHGKSRKPPFFRPVLVRKT